jgi:hypothetical protein
MAQGRYRGRHVNLYGATLRVQRSLRDTGAATLNSAGSTALADARAHRSLPTWARCGTQQLQANSTGSGTFHFNTNSPPGRGYQHATQFDAQTRRSWQFHALRLTGTGGDLGPVDLRPTSCGPKCSPRWPERSSRHLGVVVPAGL